MPKLPRAQKRATLSDFARPCYPIAARLELSQWRTRISTGRGTSDAPAVDGNVRFGGIWKATATDWFWAEPGLTIAMHCGHINDRNTPRTGP